jgi:3-deoxy-manno-octulosonate cytidylyltransferase (CMP-KDO synthetase)
MLLRETGKPLIQHTYEAASRATVPSGVIVATDHDDIAAVVRNFGGRAEMTDPQARSGTDRVAEIARKMPDVEIFVNVQGDEPEIRGESIDYVVELLMKDSAASMSTLATPIRTKHQLDDPACVKVVFDGNQRALYFSRSPIPHAREWDDALLTANPPHFFQHLGIYAYRREFLLQLALLPQSDTEQLEKLEQLRVLDNGHTILVGVINAPSIGIDTQSDYDAFVRRIRN